MIKEEQVLVYKCKCMFCSHEWRAWEVPLRCAACKRPGWNRDSKAKIEEKPILDSQGNLTGIEQTWTEVLPERELVSLDDILSWTPKKK